MGMMINKNLPHWEGCEEELKKVCSDRIQTLYGTVVPDQVKQRLQQELEIIEENNFAGLYMLCRNMFVASNVYYGDCYYRGLAGNSFVAFLCGLTNTVNPLEPHYRCDDGHYYEFIHNNTHIDTPDELAKKKCPICGKELVRDGYDLDFVFMTYPAGDRVPDFDFNVPYAMGKKMLNTLKGMDCLNDVVRAGKKTDDGIKPYLTDTLRGYFLIPKGVSVEDYCELNRETEEVYTYSDYHQVEDLFYKLDLLGHGPSTMLNDLRVYTGVNPLDISLDDEGVKELFAGEKPHGLCGIPEFRGRFEQNVIKKFRVASFGELVKFSGLECMVE